jgi:hypothetical protein
VPRRGTPDISSAVPTLAARSRIPGQPEMTRVFHDVRHRFAQDRDRDVAHRGEVSICMAAIRCDRQS